MNYVLTACISVPTAFTEKFINSNVKLNSTIKMFCTIRGSPVPKYELYKNDKPLEISEHMKIVATKNDEMTETYLVLTISKVSKEDEGTYEVKAWNSAGKASTQGKISTYKGRYRYKCSSVKTPKLFDLHNRTFF